MAAEFTFSKSAKFLANVSAIRGTLVAFNVRTRQASSLLQRRGHLARCTVAKSYSFSTKVQEEPHALENIYSAVCIERLPLITPDKTELEKKYVELQDQIELEKSALSEDEVELKKVAERKKKLTERDEDENLEIAQFEEQRKEYQEEQEEEYRNFQPASRQTEADENNDHKSTHRKLQHTLTLLLKNKDSGWQMPVGSIREKETLRQAAERMLQESCGSEINVKFLSNAPAGVMKVTDTPRNTNKVFFYKGCFTGGMVHLGSDYQDYIWVTREEMKDYLQPDYYKTVRRFVR